MCVSISLCIYIYIYIYTHIHVYIHAACDHPVPVAPFLRGRKMALKVLIGGPYFHIEGSESSFGDS